MSSQVLPRISIYSASRPVRFPIRFRLLGLGILAVLIALITSVHSQTVFDNSLQLFQGIVLDNSTKIDASIQSLQHIAGVNKYAADFIGSLTPEARQLAKTALYTEFQNFRDQMFIIHKGTIGSQEVTAYINTEQVVYNDYWAQISNLVESQSLGNKAIALQAFNRADSIFEEKIAPGIVTLEHFNYEAMLAAKDRAGTIILGDAAILGIMFIMLALLLTGISFWIRFRVRRYLTPGIDAAALLAWILVFVVFSQLAQLPEKMRVMVQDSYYSITASARVIADANRANVTESAALNDPANAPVWQQKYDKYMRLIALRLCGQTDCIKGMFSVGGTDKPDPAIVTISKRISAQDSASIDKIVPLMGNITFTGEVETLEKARLAYADYLRIDGQTRSLLAANKLDEAIKLNTGRESGQSDEAFFRFMKWMEQEKAINRAVFDRVWLGVQSSLPVAQLHYGVFGLAGVMLLCVTGVYHRFREL